MPREFKICDPACGTGGFLTEAFKTLKDNYTKIGKWNDITNQLLRDKVFLGLTTSRNQSHSQY